MIDSIWQPRFSLTDQTKVIVHQGSDGENVGRVDSRTHDLQPDFIVLKIYIFKIVLGTLNLLNA